MGRTQSRTFSTQLASIADTTKTWTTSIPTRMAVNIPMLPKKTSPPMSLKEVVASEHPDEPPSSPSPPSSWDTSSSGRDLARKLLPTLAGGHRLTHLQYVHTKNDEDGK